MKTMLVSSDTGRLALAGAVLLGLAGLFLWSDLSLDLRYLVGAAATGATFLAIAEWPRQLPHLGPLLLLACGVTGTAWYAAHPSGVLLAELGLTNMGALVSAVLTYGSARGQGEDGRARLLCFAAASTLLLGSWALHHQLLGHPLLLTLGWLVAGCTTLLVARLRGQAPLAEAAYVLVAAAVIKVVALDATHLGGPPRVLVLASTGFILLGAARLLGQRSGAERA
jgi:hypothetical protein